MKRVFKVAAMMLLSCVLMCAVGCGATEQPDWLKQAICDHEFDDKIVTKEATCTESGVAKMFCSKCGAEKSVVVKKKGHTTVIDEEILPTCISPGLTAGEHCIACGIVIVKQEIVSVMHTDEDTNGTCDLCESDIFADCDYKSVKEGDSVSGWYRTRTNSEEIGMFNLGFLSIEVDGLTVENIAEGHIALSTTSVSAGALKFDITGQIFANGWAINLTSYTTSFTDRAGWRYFYIPSEINIDLRVRDSGFYNKGTYNADISGLYVKFADKIEKAIF